MVTTLESHDAAFTRLLGSNATLEHVAAGFQFTEGPLWCGDHLLFVDIPSARIIRWQMLPEGPEVRTFRHPSGQANGLTFDKQRRLLACEHGTRTLSRTEPDGSLTRLAQSYQGKRLNSPNDVVVRSDGLIFFTDPPYGLANQREGKELPFQGVFLLRPDGELVLLVDDFDRPNGLAFSPDERRLYVDDTVRGHIRVFDVRPDGILENGRLFAELTSPDDGVPDGLKVDVEGNVYSTGPGGVWVVAPSGNVLGRIRTPERTSNVAWGEEGWSTLFITGGHSLYRIRTNAHGILVP